MSILQVGGFDQGITSSLISTLRAGTCGQDVTAKILILDPSEQTVARMQVEHSLETSTVDALLLNRDQPLSSQIKRADPFDVVLVAIEPDLEIEEKRVLLAQARGMLRAGGIFIVFDTLLNIRDK